MRATQFYLPTLKSATTETEATFSQQWMICAGMVRRLASGIYSWLPLGLRVLRKVEQIVREEMNFIDAQEILMPMVQPGVLWQESGRWQIYGPELLKMQDRHQREFCLGPTHEEVVTELVRGELLSYKQLPVIFYQIQTKFRDEIRPRFGVMRGREFLMKDAYSFHQNKASLEEVYYKIYHAYERIFERIGLQVKVVQADTGNIGGKISHEFHVMAEIGEDVIAYSDQSQYAANLELATYQIHNERIPPKQSIEKIHTPNIRTVSQLSQHLEVAPDRIAKLLIVKGRHAPYIGLILRGDHTLNPCKVEKCPEVLTPLTLVEPEEIEKIAGCLPGFIGPIGIKIPLIVDHSAANLSDFVCGANQSDYHYKGVNWERDTPLPRTADLRNVVEGDLSPDGKGVLKLSRGIEVGHIFQLGTQYSQAMNAVISTEFNTSQPMEMGCYGIGLSRIVAATIEQCHDGQKVQWPIAIAPFQVALIPIAYHSNAVVKEEADALYQQMIQRGLEVLFDDRNIRPGVSFSEMELIGIPHRVIISAKTLEKGGVEYKHQSADQWMTQEALLILLELKCGFRKQSNAGFE